MAREGQGRGRGWGRNKQRRRFVSRVCTQIQLALLQTRILFRHFQQFSSRFRATPLLLLFFILIFPLSFSLSVRLFFFFLQYFASAQAVCFVCLWHLIRFHWQLSDLPASFIVVVVVVAAVFIRGVEMCHAPSGQVKWLQQAAGSRQQAACNTHVPRPEIELDLLQSWAAAEITSALRENWSEKGVGRKGCKRGMKQGRENGRHNGSEDELNLASHANCPQHFEISNCCLRMCLALSPSLSFALPLGVSLSQCRGTGILIRLLPAARCCYCCA